MLGGLPHQCRKSRMRGGAFIGSSTAVTCHHRKAFAALKVLSTLSYDHSSCEVRRDGSLSQAPILLRSCSLNS